MEIYINNYLTRLLIFSVKGSTSKRSWLVYNPFLTAIYDTIKCEDGLYLTNQLNQVNQRLPPLLPQVVVRCALSFETTNYY